MRIQRDFKTKSCSRCRAITLLQIQLTRVRYFTFHLLIQMILSRVYPGLWPQLGLQRPFVLWFIILGIRYWERGGTGAGCQNIEGRGGGSSLHFVTSFVITLIPPSILKQRVDCWQIFSFLSVVRKKRSGSVLGKVFYCQN